jgi:hypothetical protein
MINDQSSIINHDYSWKRHCLFWLTTIGHPSRRASTIADCNTTSSSILMFRVWCKKSPRLLKTSESPAPPEKSSTLRLLSEYTGRTNTKMEHVQQRSWIEARHTLSTKSPMLLILPGLIHNSNLPIEMMSRDVCSKCQPKVWGICSAHSSSGLAVQMTIYFTHEFHIQRSIVRRRAL